MTHSPLNKASGRSLPDSDHIRPFLVWWMGPMLVWWYLAHWCATWAPIRCVIFGLFSAWLGECGQFLLDQWGPLLLDDVGTILVRWCAHRGDQTSKYLHVVMYRISWYFWCIFWVTCTPFTHVKLEWKFGDFKKTRLMCTETLVQTFWKFWHSYLFQVWFPRCVDSILLRDIGRIQWRTTSSTLSTLRAQDSHMGWLWLVGSLKW